MDFKINKAKWEVFLEVTKLLNQRFDLQPILYGSLGVQKIIGEFTEAADVDFMIESKYLIDQWPEFMATIESIGFKMIDEHEHEFVRDNIAIAFGDQVDFKKWDINPQSFEITDVEGIEFREVSAEQYLMFYQAKYSDQYRRQKKGAADDEKIRRLNDYLQTNEQG
ncbi:MAG: hypothetical protein ABH884_01660 [Candidatus Komeilibacteria bacterium]